MATDQAVSPSAAFIPSYAKKYEAVNYDHLIGMPGFSDKLLNTHFKLYQGYVANTNTALETLQDLLQADKSKTPAFAEIKRRLGWEFNGMRLHEYYFGNLGGDGQLDPKSGIAELIARDFGSVENWKKDFVSTGAMRGIGWVILYKDDVGDRLINFWIEEHQANHLSGGRPLLVMDVFEHAFIVDYGTDRAAYMDAFFKNLQWDAVGKRLL